MGCELTTCAGIAVIATFIVAFALGFFTGKYEG